jgi:hypothetical protein
MKSLKIIVPLVALLIFGALPNLALAQGTLSLSQTTINLTVGQNATVTVYSSSGQTANVTNVTNTYVTTANLTNNTLTIYGLGNGSSQITVCTYDNSCATVYVTVNGNNNNPNSGNITFSQSSISLNVNQSMTVSIYNSNNYGYSYYISSNSSSGVVTASISGSQVNLYGNYTGSSNIVVCQNSNSSCGTLYVTVNNNYNNGYITLSPTSLSLYPGQSATVSLYGSSSSYYLSSNSNSYVATATLSGSQINVLANNVGATTLSVCAYSVSNCVSLPITVSGNNNNYQTINFSPSTVSLNLNQSMTVTIYGSNVSTSGYYISSNSNPQAVTASISGNVIYLYGPNTGSSNITVCANYGGQCGTLYVYVNQSSGINNQLVFTNTTLPQPIVNQYYSTQIQVSNGTAPYTFNLARGFLPAGLTMSRNGLITGVAYSTGSATFTLIATDAYDRSTPNQDFTLTPGYTGSNGSVLGTSIYNNGTLIKDGNTIYITYKNTKTGFASMSAFSQLGFRLSNVISGSTSNLNTSGYIVTSGSNAHPWGAWIKNNNTVYFVHEAGLIPIDNYNVFIQNGGLDKLVVGANLADFARPMQSNMTVSDSRLR